MIVVASDIDNDAGYDVNTKAGCATRFSTKIRNSVLKTTISLFKMLDISSGIFDVSTQPIAHYRPCCGTLFISVEISEVRLLVIIQVDPSYQIVVDPAFALGKIMNFVFNMMN